MMMIYINNEWVKVQLNETKDNLILAMFRVSISVFRNNIWVIDVITNCIV